jgi:conjugative transfer pilus assembly protein TraH
MKRRSVNLALLFALFATITPATAQVANQMQSMFNSLGSQSNFTAPGEMNGTLEGGLSGGSIVIRNRNMTPSLFSFNPPVFGAGCGGLDLFGGSFSMISKQQMTAYMRQIASNAATYAFDLGLKALCPLCASDMQKLQEWTQAHNLSNMSSCQVAEAAVDKTGLTGWSAQRQSDALARQNSSKSDDAAKANQGPGNSSPSQDLAQANPDLAKKIFSGNIVWRAIKEANLDGQFAGGNTELMQDLMSITGTVIVCQPGLGNCNAPSLDTSNRPGQLQTTSVEHTLDMSDLVMGTSNGSSVILLKCDDTADCFNPQPTTTTDFKGFAQRLREEFLGGADGDPSVAIGGLIEKIHDQTGALTASDISYLNAFGEFGSRVRNLAIQSPSAARLFVERFADTVAAEYVYNLERDLIQAATSAVAKSHTDYGGTGVQLLRTAWVRLDADYAKVAKPPAIAEAELSYYTQVMNTMGSNTLAASISRVK